jgi:Mn-dependent DtxR family transcriptional regulator
MTKILMPPGFKQEAAALASLSFSQYALAAMRRALHKQREMPGTTSPSQSAEDYLERIDALIQEKGYARVVDIASSLGVKQASVTSMVQKLAELGYLNYEKYRGLILTDKGRAAAWRIKTRHQTLSRFFSLFGLDEKTQQQDIEGIEHHLSAATVEVLSNLAQFFEDHPATLQAFRKSSKSPRKLSS